MFGNFYVRIELFLTIFLNIIFGCRTNNPNHLHKNALGLFTISNEISNQQINCFAQDSDGYIWIGTDRGLNKYNGYEYQQYFNSQDKINSICNNTIKVVLIDSKDKLWVGTLNGISIYNKEKDIFNNVNIQSNNKNVYQILASRDNHIYANLGNSVYKYDDRDHTFYPVIDFDEISNQNRFFIDDKNKLWLVTRLNIKCYDITDLKLLASFKPEKIPNLVYCNLLHNGYLWAMHGKGGIKVINTHLLKEVEVSPSILKHLTISQALVTNVFEYSEDQLLINTHKNGLFLYNIPKKTIIPKNHPDFPFEFPKINITTIFKDNNDNLWIGTHEKGYQIIYKYKNEFNTNRPLQLLAKDNSIKTIAIDKSDNLWFSTYNDKLYIYNFDRKKVATMVDLTSFFQEDPFYQDKIKDLIVNGRDVWFITEGKILHCIYQNKKLIRKKTYQTLSILCQLATDINGNIWVSSENEYVYFIRKDVEEMKVISTFSPGIYYHSAILPLANGKILAAAPNQPFKLIDPLNNNEVSSLESHIELQNFEPSMTYEDSQENIWIGQTNGPLIKYNPRKKQVEKINIQNVTSLLIDNNNDMWIGTLNGLSHLSLKSRKLYSYYNYDGIGGNQFNIKCAAKLPDHTLAFGGTHGFTIFKPDAISMNRRIPLYIESIKVNNQYFYKTEKDSSNAYTKVNLSHNENYLNINYSALDISEYSRLRYYYKLDGYDNDWIDAKNNRTANYANLKPGHYSFKVKITGNDKSSTESESYLSINISRPPWLSWWAISFYAIIITYIVWIILNLYSRLRMNKAKIQMAIREKEHEAYINNMNMSFFSNISHEFRTPLTIISAPISSLYNSQKNNPEEKKVLELIQRSIKRMLRLVNQLMDLSKLEADALKLRVSRIDILYQIQSTLELYVLYGKDKEISFSISGLENSFFMLTDLDKIEKIIGNILSNALKFTPPGGEIRFSFEIVNNQYAIKEFPAAENFHYKGDYAFFSIKDNGPGIPEEKLENIFLKYYQIDNMQNANFNWGTGIGLYYTRKLIDLHHGFIKAENSEHGAVFSFIIPIEDNAYNENEIFAKLLDETNNINTPITKSKKTSSLDISQKEIADNSKETILIVDDDIEVSFYLKTLFEKDYNIVNKYDGETAYENLEEINPVLIISDVVMPGLNGYELCTKIKENISFCHIPVILLTAKSLLEEKIEGLETGANAYVTKPFEAEYLLAIVKSQIFNIKLVSKLLTTNTNTTKANKDILSPKDKVFMDKLFELIEKELDNPEMNVTVIAEKMGMSRTKFYHKIKALAKETPNSFIKKYKLNRAAEFIKSGENNISEIAYMTGFINLAHFSVSFKKQFGCSPSEYKG